MSIRLILAASAALAFAAPAFAQDTPSAPPAAEATSPEEAALEAKANVFEGRMRAMAAEMQTAATAVGADPARRTADLDAIEARYQPEAEAFAAELEAFLNAEAAKTPDEAKKAELAAAVSGAVPAIRGIPAQVRAAMAQAAAAPAPAAQ